MENRQDLSGGIMQRRHPTFAVLKKLRQKSRQGLLSLVKSAKNGEPLHGHPVRNSPN
jgi:hypothetical protein